MFHALKRHPFGIEAHFRRSLVLTYAVPRAALADLVDPGLQLDTYDDWGFLAIAMVETLNLRPRGFPKWLGRDFFLSGYRIFTRFVRAGRPTLRGLRILRSDTDRRSMARLGNLFTYYNYGLAKVRISTEASRLEIIVRTPDREADLHVVADLASCPAALPASSPFRTMEDARSFAGPLPFTFSYDAKLQKMVVIKGLRSAWNPQPIQVDVREATFLEQPRFSSAGIRLANAFYLESTPYRWKAGTLEACALPAGGHMTRRSGAVRILLYNWPVYVATWSAAALLPLAVWLLLPRFSTIAGIVAAGAVVSSVASLLISFYIYDRSQLVSGAWMGSLVRPLDGPWATIHAGLDAEVDLDAVMTGPCVGRLDIFDPTIMTASSIARARRRTAQTHLAISCSPTALVLEDQSCDAVVVAFTAHEIRDVQARERFFEELTRVLRPGGKLVLVEHLRDLANLLVFGPGAFHFLPRQEWLRLASRVKLSIAREMRITPWVTALALERSQ